MKLIRPTSLNTFISSIWSIWYNLVYITVIYNHHSDIALYMAWHPNPSTFICHQNKSSIINTILSSVICHSHSLIDSIISLIAIEDPVCHVLRRSSRSSSSSSSSSSDNHHHDCHYLISFISSLIAIIIIVITFIMTKVNTVMIINIITFLIIIIVIIVIIIMIAFTFLFTGFFTLIDFSDQGKLSDHLLISSENYWHLFWTYLLSYVPSITHYTGQSCILWHGY